MSELIRKYIEYLSSLKQIDRPKMPKFDLKAYTDSEYTSAINSILADFDVVDDLQTTIKFLN